MTDTERAVALLKEIDDLAEQQLVRLVELRKILGASAGPEKAGSGGRGPLPLAVAPLVRERLVTPDSMAVGGWMRLPGSATPDVWRQIERIAECECPAGRSRHHLRMTFRGIAGAIHPAGWDTFSYLSDAEFQAAADREQVA